MKSSNYLGDYSVRDVGLHAIAQFHRISNRDWQERLRRWRSRAQRRPRYTSLLLHATQLRRRSVQIQIASKSRPNRGRRKGRRQGQIGNYRGKHGAALGMCVQSRRRCSENCIRIGQNGGAGQKLEQVYCSKMRRVCCSGEPKPGYKIRKSSAAVSVFLRTQLIE